MIISSPVRILVVGVPTCLPFRNKAMLRGMLQKGFNASFFNTAVNLNV